MFRSPGLTGLWAAARANLGVTVRSSYWVPSGLRVLDAAQIGLPELGDTEVSIHYFEDTLSVPVREMVKQIERSILLRWNKPDSSTTSFPHKKQTRRRSHPAEKKVRRISSR